MNRCPPKATLHQRDKELDVHTSLLVPPEAMCNDTREAVPESVPEAVSSSSMRESVVRAECSKAAVADSAMGEPSPRAELWSAAPATAPVVYSLLWPSKTPPDAAGQRRPSDVLEDWPATDCGFTENSEHRQSMPPDSEDPPTIYEEDSEADKWIVGCCVHKGESGDAAIWPTYRMRDKAEVTWWRPQAVPIHRAKWLYEYAVQQWQLRNPEEAAQVGADGIQPIV